MKKLSRLDELTKLLEDPAFLREYDLWRNEPMSQRVFEAAALLTKPVPLQTPTVDRAAFLYHELLGAERVLSFIRGVDQVRAAVQEAEASYGVQEVDDHILAARRRVNSRKKAATAPAAG